MLVDRQSGEIFLYQPIGAMFEGGITAEGVIVALDSLGGKRATIRINSPGGEFDTGFAIYHALKRHRGGVDTVVDSLAASVSSIIALAGESRRTAKGSRWMVHQAITFASGNARDFAKVVEVLSKHDESLIEIYAESLKLPPESIMQMLAAETWFTTTEAIAAGLATSLDNSEAVVPNVANWFKNAPAAIYKEAVEAKKPFPANRLRALYGVR